MFILKIFLLFMPNRIKISCYRSMGAEIGGNCKIGFSLIDVEDLQIGDNVLIGHFNVLRRLKRLTLGSGSRVDHFNWISGAGRGVFKLGRNSAITKFHRIDASSNFIIGSNSIIAGLFSQFITHGSTPRNIDDFRSISIGDWCYIGSSSRFVPGSGIGDYTFVGMGAVVTKHFKDSCVLLAGNPATVKKTLSQEDAYFNRSYLPHDHHSISYKG
jgi:acetyltransferase-like isoleucine patch superfamily enzyme